MADLTTAVGSLTLATPTIAASGTYGYGVEIDGLVDWSRVGGVSVKGLSVGSTRGHAAPRMVETPAGVLNAIGLQNIGVDAFVRDKLPALSGLGPRVVANCWGNDVDAYRQVVERLDDCGAVDAVELNLSCPHKPEWGGVIAADVDATVEVVAAARERTALPLWVKLSPNVTDIGEIARAAVGAGADVLVAVNTLRGLVIDIDTRKAALAYGRGGLSGPAIRPVALHCVRAVREAVDVPVVGAGGVVSGRDALEFLIAGASAVEVGTANLYDAAAPARIADEIDEQLERLGEDSVAAVIDTMA